MNSTAGLPLPLLSRLFALMNGSRVPGVSSTALKSPTTKSVAINSIILIDVIIVH